MESRPALKFCLLLTGGIVLGSLLSVGPGLLFWIVAGLLLAAAASFLPVFPAGVSVSAPAFALLVVAFGAFLWSVHDGAPARGDPAVFIGPDTLTITGSVAEAPGRGGRSMRFILDADSLFPSRDSGAGGPADHRGTGDAVEKDVAELSGRVIVVLSGRALSDSTLLREIRPGGRVSIRGPILEIEPPGNPGEIDWQAHYRLSGIRARIPVRSAGLVKPLGPGGQGFLNRYVLPVRLDLARRIGSFIGDREARFLNGLVLGERNEVPTDLRADFITVGVMHLLAISGQQVVLVAMLIAGLLAMLRVPEKPRFIVTSLALVYYVFLTGASPSVTRAGIMSIVMLGARVAQRRADVFNAIGVAASGILLWDPKQLFDPGFLLSFGAVLAIVLLYPLVLRAFPAVTARCERVRLLDLAWKGSAVSLAAGVGTAPIVAWFFGRISLVGFVANLLIVPLSSIALVLGLLTLGASFVWDWLASVYGAAADFSARLTFDLVGFFSGLPYASVDFRLSLAALAAFYLLVALVLISTARNSWKPLLIGVLFLANAVVWSGFAASPEGGILRVTFLDVGQGDAALVEFPGGETMLVDAGPRTFSFDAGARAVVPFLRYRGIGKIDHLVISHPHGDHFGGAEAVLRALPVGELVEGGTPGQGTMYERMVALADSLRVPRVQRCEGGLIGAGAFSRAYVLSPDCTRDDGSGGPNDRSIVVLVRYGVTSVLFPGDAEEGAEAAMVARYGGFLDADILKAGHHGSRTSSTTGFLHEVSPAWTLISSGEGNNFGHPSPVILSRLAAAGSAIHRTDRSGAAVFESDGVSWTPVEWRR